jgi:plasmid replication initiation protein|tara:strand:- start:9481 stop:10545 length:1065 start_codon:yes stop_codon:yes gene_type:complete
METKTTNPDYISVIEAKWPLPLMSDRYFQHELFICDVADAVPNDLVIHMGHPFYSLSKKPEMNVRRYEHNGNWIEITPSVKGLATIYDKDILIYCISQIMAKLKNNEPVSPRVRISSRDLLIFTNRGTSGRDYMALIQGLDRLEGTRIRTNIRSGDKEQSDSFGLIDSSSIHRKKGLDGRLLWCEVTLSAWVFNAIRAQEVLTLHSDYFRLRKPIERRVYEIARKHCGHQNEWKIGLEALYKKTGCQSPLKRFRQMFRVLVDYNHLPEYRLIFDAVSGIVSFCNRETDTYNSKLSVWEGFLKPEAYNDARLVAPGCDVYLLEHKWRSSIGGNKIKPNNLTKSFIEFCRIWHKKI